MRQHGRWGLISTNRVTGKNCFIGVTVGTRTEGLRHACVLWCQWCPWFLFITTTIQCQAVIMILITPWHPGDVRHMRATELRPRFKCVSARLRPDLQPAMGRSPLISSLCQLLLKPICHKETDKRKRRERRAEGEGVSMQNRAWGAVQTGKGNVETKIFLKVLFWGGVCVVGHAECGRGWGRAVGCHHLGVRALKVHERFGRSSEMVWGTLQKPFMMNVGYRGPLGLCHLTHRQRLNPMSTSHPTFLQVCSCLGMCSSRTQLWVSLSFLRRLM